MGDNAAANTYDPTGTKAAVRVPVRANSRSGIVHSNQALKEIVDLGDAPTCHICGAIMTRNGSCYRCAECGSTSGCS